MYYDLETDDYPLSEHDIRALWPDASFPSPFVPPERWVVPAQTAQPAYDAETHNIAEMPPVRSGDTVTQAWQVVALTADQIATELNSRVTTLLQQIDADADAIYSAALGNRAIEYAQAEADATAYKDADYSGDVPGYVQSWATATGKTAQWAADDILATAQGWRDAQAQIRLNRLSRKELARKATTAAELDTVRTQWAAFVVAIRTQLRI